MFAIASRVAHIFFKMDVAPMHLIYALQDGAAISIEVIHDGWTLSR